MSYNKPDPTQTLVLAHYYTTPDVQAMAHHVGDSLDLAMKGVEYNPDRIVFAGVKFMQESAKILNPQAEVISPDLNASCSLVEQTNVDELYQWDQQQRQLAKQQGYDDVVHVAYINSSAAHKAVADMIVTSRIVVDVIKQLHDQGRKVIFSPDRNMGEYLNWAFDFGMPVWSAVCDVHDQFTDTQLSELLDANDGKTKYLLAHPESPLPVLKRADLVASTHGMLRWIEQYDGDKDAIVYVATEEGLLFNMYQIREDLDLRLAPTYGGTCTHCATCPFMKMNTTNNVFAALNGFGTRINYLTDQQIESARVPIERMMHYQKTKELIV